MGLLALYMDGAPAFLLVGVSCAGLLKDVGAAAAAFPKGIGIGMFGLHVDAGVSCCGTGDPAAAPAAHNETELGLALQQY